MKPLLRHCCPVLGLSLVFLSFQTLGKAAEPDDAEQAAPSLEVARADVLPGYPDAFHLTYIADNHSFSPDRKYAMIYPNGKSFGGEERKNYLVLLHPLRVLALTAIPYYPNSRHGGDVFFHWSKDSNTVIIGTIGRLLGVTSVELYELRDGKIVRETDLLAETMRLAEPDFHRAGARPQGESLNFSETNGEDFDSKPNRWHWRMDDQGQVRIECAFSNAAEAETSSEDWHVEVQATWNVKEHKFTQQKVKRVKQ